MKYMIIIILLWCTFGLTYVSDGAKSIKRVGFKERGKIVVSWGAGKVVDAVDYVDRTLYNDAQDCCYDSAQCMRFCGLLCLAYVAGYYEGVQDRRVCPSALKME